MSTRRVTLPVAVLIALALPVFGGAIPAAASGSATAPEPAARGQAPGEPEGPDSAEKPQDDCPTELWTIPLEIKGLACVLLLPKPESDEGSGGVLG